MRPITGQALPGFVNWWYWIEGIWCHSLRWGIGVHLVMHGEKQCCLKDKMTYSSLKRAVLWLKIQHSHMITLFYHNKCRFDRTYRLLVNVKVLLAAYALEIVSSSNQRTNKAVQKKQFKMKENKKRSCPSSAAFTAKLSKPRRSFLLRPSLERTWGGGALKPSSHSIDLIEDFFFFFLKD